MDRLDNEIGCILTGLRHYEPLKPADTGLLHGLHQDGSGAARRG